MTHTSERLVWWSRFTELEHGGTTVRGELGGGGLECRAPRPTFPAALEVGRGGPGRVGCPSPAGCLGCGSQLRSVHSRLSRGCGQLGRLWSTPSSGAGGEGGPSGQLSHHALWCRPARVPLQPRPGSPSPSLSAPPTRVDFPHPVTTPAGRFCTPHAAASLSTWVPRARVKSQPCPEEGPLPPHGAHAGTLAHAGECHCDSDPPGWASLKPTDWVLVTDSGGCFRDNLFIRPLGSPRLSRSTAGGPDRALPVTGDGVGGGFLQARGGGAHHGGKSGAGLGHPGLTWPGPSPATEVPLV